MRTVFHLRPSLSMLTKFHPAIDKHRIHTVIPSHEVTHEAPIIHQSQTHAPVPLEHFLQKGGTLTGALTHEEIGNRVLFGGDCTREVDGVGERLAKELHLGDATVCPVLCQL